MKYFFLIASYICCFLAFPPFFYWPFAWFVPAFWRAHIEYNLYFHPDSWKNDYLSIWGISSIFVALDNYWGSPFFSSDHKVQLAWVVISTFMGLFYSCFFYLVSLCTRTLKVPTLLLLPIIWCALEWLRRNIMFGFLVTPSLEHSFCYQPYLIQTACIFGEYGVGFLVMLVGSAIGRFLRFYDYNSLQSHCISEKKIMALLIIILVPSIMILHGYITITNSPIKHNSATTVSVAVLQCDSEDAQAECLFTTPVLLLAEQAAERGADLVVWPECSSRLTTCAKDYFPPGWHAFSQVSHIDSQKKWLEHVQTPFLRYLERVHTNNLIGIIKIQYDDNSIKLFNSAVFVSEDRDNIHVYDKHKLYPVLENVFTHGQEYTLFSFLPHMDSNDDHETDMTSYNFCVNICFESFLPHVVSKQVRELAKQNLNPDFLVCLSNDRNESASTIHIPTHVFRAIEMRRPYLSSTKGGTSLWVDEYGRIIKKGKKNSSGYIMAIISKKNDIEESFYLKYGDFLPSICLLFLLGALAMAIIKTLIHRVPIDSAN